MSSPDTTPDYPLPPESAVASAARDLPAILQEMPSEQRFGAAPPEHQQRVVLAQSLVEELAREGRHTRGAAAWAVHRLVTQGLLLAEVGTRAEHPVLGYRPDPDRLVVRARRYFGTHADAPRYQIPVHGAPVPKPLAPDGRPVPYECLLVRSTPALWEWWLGHAAPPATRPVFSREDFDRALSALDLALQDYDWGPGDNALLVETVVGALAARGVTHALAEALLDQLVEQQVLTPRADTTPAGYSYEPSYPAPHFQREPQTTHTLITTRERWYTYLAARRRPPASERGAPCAAPSANGGGPVPRGGTTAEAVVAEFLASHPGPSLDAVVNATGLSPNAVRRTAAWKEHEEALLDQYLQANATASTGDVKRAFGFCRSKVVGMRAWREHQARRQAARPPRPNPERPLTPAMLECRPDAPPADPADRVAGRDQLFRVILEGADADTRARLHGLPAARQAALIEHVLGQMDGAAEARDGAATRQILVAIAQSWLEEHEQERRREGRAGRGQRRG